MPSKLSSKHHANLWYLAQKQNKKMTTPHAAYGRLVEAALCTDIPAPNSAIRRLRSWHWQQMQQYRLMAIATNGSKELHDIANRHLRAVQTLNEYFPIGDTAHKDASVDERQCDMFKD